MSQRLSDFKDWVDIGKKFFEVFTVCAAGGWAYSQYFSGEAPAFEERAQISMRVLQEDESNDRCPADVHIGIKNIGKRSFDIKSLQIRVWLADVPELFDATSSQSDFDVPPLPPPIADAGIRLILLRSIDASTPPMITMPTVAARTRHEDAGVYRLDPDALMNLPPIYTSTLGTGKSVTGHYAPEMMQTDDYWLVLPPKHNKLAIYRVTGNAVASLDHKKPVTVDDWRWMESCTGTDTDHPEGSGPTQIAQAPGN